MTSPRVAAVLVSYNTRDELLRALESLEAEAHVTLELIVVDNASRDGSAAAVRAAFPQARVIENAANLGFGAACNRGIREAAAPYLLLLNSDAELRAGALETLVRVLDERPNVGAVGPRTLNADGTPQVSFGPDLTPLAEWRQRRLVRGVRRRDPAALQRAAARAQAECEPAWLSAACLLARREALLGVGGFDEGFFLYEEDADLCLRLRRRGWRLLYTPEATVVHHLGRSVDAHPGPAALEYHRSHLRYYRKHNGSAARAALRLRLALRALAGWLAASGRADARIRRAHNAAVLRLALRGE